MFTVALIAQKGGVGKTTLTLTLASLAAQEGLNVGIIDADSSKNAAKWAERREQHQERKDDPPLVVAGNEKELREAVNAARADKTDFLFIDTGAGVAELPAKAAALADLLLLPCIPQIESIEGMQPTAALANKLGKPAFFVINKGRNSRTLNNDAAIHLTSEYGLPAVATHLQFRWPIGDASLLGQTLIELESRDASALKGQSEFRALWKWVKQRAGETHE